jgi:hypothetical protein
MRAPQFVVRWQELMGWLPATVAAVLAAWLILGALLPWGSETAIEGLIDLALRMAYALAAAGVARLLWRRWRLPLTEAERAAYWAALMRGERGAIVAYCAHTIVYLAVIALCLAFFWVAR